MELKASRTRETEITQELENLTETVAFKGSGDRLLLVEGMSCQETERLELGLFPFSSRPPPLLVGCVARFPALRRGRTLNSAEDRPHNTTIQLACVKLS